MSWWWTTAPPMGHPSCSPRPKMLGYVSSSPTRPMFTMDLRSTSAVLARWSPTAVYPVGLGARLGFRRRTARALRKALSVVEGPDPALVGETGWDQWNQCETLGLYSLLIRPSRVWRPALTPFSSGGNPSHDMLMSAKAAGLVAKPFPFTADGYVIHRGRGSLAAVAASEERTNPLYSWACDHHEPHFGAVPGAEERYRKLVAAFRSDVGTVSGSSLVASCLRQAR